LKKKWVGQIEESDKWWILEVYWIFVASMIWVLLVHHSLGVTTNLMGKLLGSG